MAGPKYLLDTNVVSAVIRRPQGPIARRLAAMDRSEFGISIVVACELRYGMRRRGSPRLSRQVEAVLEGIDILPLEEPVDEHYGRIRSELEGAGQPIGHNDLLIAAHARALGATFVTANVDELNRVSGLDVENWEAEG